MVTILWARHGENVANLCRTFSYRVFDGDLTSRGQRQAWELAGRLAADGGEPLTYLACSPLRRARQTAQIVARRLGLTVAAELDGLRELNVGALDGRSDTQAWIPTPRCSRPGGRAGPMRDSLAVKASPNCVIACGRR